MKYLKRFNEGKQDSSSSSNMSQISQDVKDITLDLSDGDFAITHISQSTLDYLIIDKIVSDDDLNTMLDSFRYSEVKETMDRLFEYLDNTMAYGANFIEAQVVKEKNAGRIETITINLVGNPDKENYVNNQLKDSHIRTLKLFYATK